MLNHIFIKGAKEHNLKSIDVKIPRNKLVVISNWEFSNYYNIVERSTIESIKVLKTADGVFLAQDANRPGYFWEVTSL